MSAVSKQPNFMRYARVSTVIESEPALKRRLGTKTETVFKPDGTKHEFPKEVIVVTDRIHSSGIDAHTASRNDIIKVATQLLVLENGAPSADKSDAAKPKSAKAKKPEPKNEKPKNEKPKNEKPKKTIAPPALASKPVVGVVTAPPAGFPFVVGCAIASNLIAASQLLELHDRTPEGGDMRDRLDKIIDEIQQRAVISNGAKETQSKSRS